MKVEAHCIVCGVQIDTDFFNYGFDMMNHYNKKHHDISIPIEYVYDNDDGRAKDYKPIYLYNTTKMSENNNNENNQEQEQEVTKETETETTETETKETVKPASSS